MWLFDGWAGRDRGMNKMDRNACSVAVGPIVERDEHPGACFTGGLYASGSPGASLQSQPHSLGEWGLWQPASSDLGFTIS